jgi:PAS domain S-box-containing protein
LKAIQDDSLMLYSLLNAFKKPETMLNIILTTTYLWTIILVLFSIPLFTIFFTIKRIDLKFRRIFFSFSLSSFVMGVGLLYNYDLAITALTRSPIIGFLSFFFILIAIGSIVSGYKEILSMPSKSVFVWTQQSLNLALKNYQNAAETLKNNEEKIAKIMQYSLVSMIVIDKDLVIQGVNKACLELLGYERSELLNKKILNLLHTKEENRQRIKLYYLQLAQENQGQTEVVQRIVKKDGSRFLGKVMIYTVKNNTNKEQHTVIQILDLSKELKLQEQTEQFNKILQNKVTEQTQELRKKNKNLEQFNYAIAHDLRAPIKNLDALFGAYLDFEEEATRSPMQNKCAAHIQKNLRKMDRMIGGLLLFFQSQAIEIKKVTYNPMHQILEIFNELKNTTYTDRNIIFKVEELPEIYADSNAIYHVWQNLISNALKFSPNRNPIEITIWGKKENGKVTFFIKDNGLGFDKAQAQTLFEPFKRMYSYKEIAGTGLGLSIVLEIIEKHFGKISAQSEPNKGSTFSFSLPEKEALHWYDTSNYDNLIKEDLNKVGETAWKVLKAPEEIRLNN